MEGRCFESLPRGEMSLSPKRRRPGTRASQLEGLLRVESQDTFLSDNTGQLRSVDVAVEFSGNRPLTRRPAAAIHRSTSSINASLGNLDRPSSAPGVTAARRDAGTPQLAVAPGKSRGARLLAMTRRGVGFPIFRVLRAAPRALQDAEGFPLRRRAAARPLGQDPASEAAAAGRGGLARVLRA